LLLEEKNKPIMGIKSLVSSSVQVFIILQQINNQQLH